MNAPIRTQYFAPDSDAAATLAEAIDARIAELMEPGAPFDPLEPDNFDEALAETLEACPGIGFPRKLAVCLRWGGDLRNMLTGMSHTYWEPKAEAQANDEFEGEQGEARLEAYLAARAEA